MEGMSSWDYSTKGFAISLIGFFAGCFSFIFGVIGGVLHLDNSLRGNDYPANVFLIIAGCLVCIGVICWIIGEINAEDPDLYKV